MTRSQISPTVRPGFITAIKQVGFFFFCPAVKGLLSKMFCLSGNFAKCAAIYRHDHIKRTFWLLKLEESSSLEERKDSALWTFMTEVEAQLQVWWCASSILSHTLAVAPLHPLHIWLQHTGSAIIARLTLGERKRLHRLTGRLPAPSGEADCGNLLT